MCRDGQVNIMSESKECPKCLGLKGGPDSFVCPECGGSGEAKPSEIKIPFPTKGQENSKYGGWILCPKCRKVVKNDEVCDCMKSQKDPESSFLHSNPEPETEKPEPGSNIPLEEQTATYPPEVAPEAIGKLSLENRVMDLEKKVENLEQRIKDIEGEMVW